MKLDYSKEMAWLKRFSMKSSRAGEGMQRAGNVTMNAGCLVMLIGMLGLLLLAVIL